MYKLNNDNDELCYKFLKMDCLSKFKHQLLHLPHI